MTGETSKFSIARARAISSNCYAAGINAIPCVREIDCNTFYLMARQSVTQSSKRYKMIIARRNNLLDLIAAEVYLLRFIISRGN